ncbi:MAG: TolC family outer membrane protein [Luteimonas sp.]
MSISAGLLMFLATTVHATGLRPKLVSDVDRYENSEILAAGASGVATSGRAGFDHDLGSVVARAVQTHPGIAEVIGSLRFQQQQVGMARSQYLPQINGGLRAGYDSVYDGDGQSHAFVLSASQMLYDFGKVSSQVRAEEAGVAQEQARVLLTIDQIAHQTAHAAVEVQRYQNLLVSAEAQIESLERVAALVRERNRLGASSRSDLVQSESRIAGASSLVIQNRAQVQRWRAQLASLAGLAQLQGVSDFFPSLPTEVCSPEGLEHSAVPALLVARSQRDRARAQLDNARAQTFPTLTIEPSVTRYLNDNRSVVQDRDRTQYGIFMNVNVPLYQGGGLVAQRRAASHAFEAAEFAVQAALLTARQSLLESGGQLSSLQGSLDILARRQALSTETRDLYRQQYLELGTRSLLDLLNAEQEIHQAGFDHQNTISDLRQLQLTCLFSSGAMRSTFALENRAIQGLEVYP